MNLKELSRSLGLSPTTVSRALNGYPEVSEQTRRRVLDAAARHNYAPNARATRLATGRTMTIGHVMPTSTKHELVNPIFADFIAGAGDVYGRRGYDLQLSVVADTEEESVYRALAARGSVDGVVLHAPKLKDPRIPLLSEIGLPFVVHGRSSQVDAPYSWLDVNNRRAFSRATSLLFDLGHRRIALVNGLEEHDFAARRRRGFCDAHEAHGIAPDEDLMFSAEMTEFHGYSSTREVLALPSPPTAILASSVIVGFGVRRAIADAGLQMGREVSVVVHDDDLSYFRGGSDVPVFTAVKSSVREAGRRVAQMLLDRIEAREERIPAQVLLEADLTIGSSTGPAPERRLTHA